MTAKPSREEVAESIIRNALVWNEDGWINPEGVKVIAEILRSREEKLEALLRRVSEYIDVNRLWPIDTCEGLQGEIEAALQPESAPAPAEEPRVEPPGYTRQVLTELLAWAEGMWDSEVKHRPVVNVYREMLDACWTRTIDRLKQALRELEEMGIAGQAAPAPPEPPPAQPKEACCICTHHKRHGFCASVLCECRAAQPKGEMR